MAADNNFAFKIANCMIAIDSIWKLVIALSNDIIADPLRRTVYPQFLRYKRQTTERRHVVHTSQNSTGN